MFDDELRQRLRMGKYTNWAADLSRDQLVAVLSAVSEYGLRSIWFLDKLEKDDSPLALDGHICLGAARLKAILFLLRRMTRERIGTETLFKVIHDAVREWEKDFYGQ